MYAIRSYYEAFVWAAAMVGSAIIAVTMRTLDLNTCDVIPVGTHFFWHIFLGVSYNFV